MEEQKLYQEEISAPLHVKCKEVCYFIFGMSLFLPIIAAILLFIITISLDELGIWKVGVHDGFSLSYAGAIITAWLCGTMLSLFSLLTLIINYLKTKEIYWGAFAFLIIAVSFLIFSMKIIPPKPLYMEAKNQLEYWGQANSEQTY